MTEASDSGTRTKTRQTRAQWLDAHEIHDLSLRKATLENFETRDDIQAYITKMQRPGFSSGDLFDVDSLLALPRILEVPPIILMAWRKAIGEGPLIDVFEESWHGGTTNTSRLRADLHACIRMGMPPEYLDDSPGHNFYWSRRDIMSAWEAGISIEDLWAYLRAASYRRLNKDGLRRMDIEDSGSISAVLALHSTGVPASYLDALRKSVTMPDAGALFRSGADADAVIARLEAQPGLAIGEMLAEIESMTPQYWNVIN